MIRRCQYCTSPVTQIGETPMKRFVTSLLCLLVVSFTLASNAVAADNKAEAKTEKAQESASEVGPRVGQKAPNFTLPDADGNKHTLKDYRGKIVILEWTNPHCPFVQRHYKNDLMQKTQKMLASKNDDIVWLTIDSSHHVKPKDSKKWQNKHDFSYPILHDPDGEVGLKSSAKTTPHMFVIGKKGTVRYNGAIDNDEMGNKDSRTNYVAQAVKALKNGEKPDPSKTKPYGCSVKYE